MDVVSIKDSKVDLVADCYNKIQLPRTVLEALLRGESVSRKQIELSLKDLDEVERLLERFK